MKATKEIIPAFQAALTIDPKHIDTYINLATAYVATGDQEKAKDILIQGYESMRDDSMSEESSGLKETEEETVAVGHGVLRKSILRNNSYYDYTSLIQITF